MYPSSFMFISFNIIIIIFLLYSILYLYSFVHRPKVYSKSSQVLNFSSSLIFPMFFMPCGTINSIIQLFRNVKIHKNVRKRSEIIPVDSDAKILIEIYEPLEPFRKSKNKKDFNIKPHCQFLILFSITKFLSKYFFGLLLQVISGIFCMCIWLRFINYYNIFFYNYVPISAQRTMKNVILKIKNRWNRKAGIIKRILNKNKNGAIDIDKRENSTISNNSDFIEHNILLIHGLNGSSNSTYIKGMTNTFIERNCRVTCFNARGAQLEPTTNMFNHIGMISDVSKVVEYILSNYKGDLTLVGFSMGANWVGKFLGNCQDYSRIKMGICVCCPFDFLRLNNHFKEGFFRKLLCGGMLKNYKRYLKRSLAYPIDFSDCNTIEEVDSKLLSEIYKCESLEEHYKNSSCIDVLENIKVPTLFLSATDDPIIPDNIVPVFLSNENPNLNFVLIRGGHLGFFSNGEKTVAEVLVGKFYDIFHT